MASESQRLVPLGTYESQPQSESSGERRSIDIYRPKPSPLPNNRPIADNSTEDIDDMLGYLD